MGYAGFYINLDRRPDRAAEIEAELSRYGVLQNYRRFPAADGNALGFSNPHLAEGEMGCFTSHYLLLKQNLEQTQTLHILEDDVLFAPQTAAVINGVIDQDLFAGCDIVYTDVYVPLQNTAYKIYKELYDQTVTRSADGALSTTSFTILALAGLPFGSTSSYLVNKHSIQKLHDLYEKEIASAPRQPNDLFIRRLSDEGALKVGCLFPFVTSVQLDHILESDIKRNYQEMSALAAHLGRYSFFIGMDSGKCQKYIEKLMPAGLPSDSHSLLLQKLMGFSLTDKYKRL